MPLSPPSNSPLSSSHHQCGSSKQPLKNRQMEVEQRRRKADKTEPDGREDKQPTHSTKVQSLKGVCHLPTNTHYIFPRIVSHCFHLWTQ